MSRNVEIIQTHQSGEIDDDYRGLVSVVRETSTKLLLPEADHAQYDIDGIGILAVSMQALNTRGEVVEVEQELGYWTRYAERLTIEGEIVGGTVVVDLHNGKGETQLSVDTIVKASDNQWTNKMRDEEWRRNHPHGNWI